MDQACMKCGYTRFAHLVPAAECPRCGAIYAKVAAAVAQGRPVYRVRTSGFASEVQLISRQKAGAADGPASMPAAPDTETTPSPSASQHRLPLLPTPDTHTFVKLLRSESHYPTFRTVVNAAFWIGIAIAILCVTGGVIVSRGSATALPLLIAIAAALGWTVVVVMAREAALMIADLSDAALRIAQVQEKTWNEYSERP